MASGRSRSSPYGYKRAWNYALWLLGNRAYTRAELRRKLARKGVTEADMDGILERLEDYSFVDDGAYARSYVRDRGSRKGEIALRQELRHKGVAEGDIASALTPLDEAAQLASATALLVRHAWRFSKGDPQRARARAFAFLARRGFPAGVARGALERSGVGRAEEDG